jgi:hypothetical protein
VTARTVEGMAPYPGQARCLALGFWPECFRRLNVEGGQRPFQEETRSALDIEGKHVTIQGPSPDPSPAAALAPSARATRLPSLTDPQIPAGTPMRIAISGHRELPSATERLVDQAIREQLAAYAGREGPAGLCASDRDASGWPLDLKHVTGTARPRLMAHPMIDHSGPLPVADDRWPWLVIADASMLKLGVE